MAKKSPKKIKLPETVEDCIATWHGLAIALRYLKENSPENEEGIKSIREQMDKILHRLYVDKRPLPEGKRKLTEAEKAGERIMEQAGKTLKEIQKRK